MSTMIPSSRRVESFPLLQMLDTSQMIPVGRISDPGVAEFGREAQDFLSGKPWCKKVGEGYLAWAIAGVVGVFLFRLIPTRDDVDETLWVVVGDLPPAYLVCDNAADWH